MKQPNNSVNAPIFTKSEIKVVELLVRGYSEKEIADKLFLSRYTVDNHLRNIRERNGLNKNTEVILLYIAYVRHKKFSLKNLRELGLGAVLILLNVCQYTTMHP